MRYLWQLLTAATFTAFFYSCEIECSTVERQIIETVNQSQAFIKYRTAALLPGQNSKGTARVYPERVLIGFNHLNEWHGSGTNYLPDQRFTTEEMVKSYEAAIKEGICMCDCETDRLSEFELLVTPQVDNLVYVLLYNKRSVKVNFKEGYFNLTEGRYLEYLFEISEAKNAKLLHEGEVNYEAAPIAQ